MTSIAAAFRSGQESDICLHPHCINEHKKDPKKVPLHSRKECKEDPKSASEYMCCNCFLSGHHESLCSICPKCLSSVAECREHGKCGDLQKPKWIQELKSLPARKREDIDTCLHPYCLFRYDKDPEKTPLHSEKECNDDPGRMRKYQCSNCFLYGHHELVCNVCPDCHHTVTECETRGICEGHVCSGCNSTIQECEQFGICSHLNMEDEDA